MTNELEVNFDEARSLVNRGSKIYVFLNNYADLDLVKELFVGAKEVEALDYNEASTIAFSYKDRDLSSQYGLKYGNAVIICPHGNSSLRFAKSLFQLGIRAYSLRGGIEGLKSR